MGNNWERVVQARQEKELALGVFTRSLFFENIGQEFYFSVPGFPLKGRRRIAEKGNNRKPGPLKYESVVLVSQGFTRSGTSLQPYRLWAQECLW